MAKTFKISNIISESIGDVELSSIGRPEFVETRDKLIQDILEILLVIKGNRDIPRTSPKFGSDILKILGYPLPAGSIETLLRNAIDVTIRELKTLQKAKSNLSDKERIVKISVLEVKKELTGLGYYFYLQLLTAEGQEVRLERVLY